MTGETLQLGEKLGGTRSIPEYIQVSICVGVLAVFGLLWTLDAVNYFVLIFGMFIAVGALYALAYCIPAFRSTLRVYEHGLEMIVQGKEVALRYDQLTSIAVRLTHHKVKQQYVGTQIRLELIADGRFSPHVYEGDYRQGSRSERLIDVAVERCCQAIQRRLLAELERAGAVRWRDGVSLTADGIQLQDAPAISRLIPYREIGAWKIDDNHLKIWKEGDGLPCLRISNASPNFAPLLGLFESLHTATRNIEASREEEPAVAGV